MRWQSEKRRGEAQHEAHLRHVTALLLVICCLLSVVGCQRGAGEEPYEAEKFIIGVAVYDPDSAEMPCL